MNSIDCPFKTAQNMIAGKYKQQVLWLLMEGTLRFSQLQRKIPEVSAKVLTEQLRQLESDGLVIRTVSGGVTLKVEYSLTDIGRETRPMLLSVRDWGKHYLSLNGVDCACEHCRE